MTGRNQYERRQHPRVYVPVAATLFSDDARCGDYLVQNLSAGGALLTHGPPIPAGAMLRVLLVGPSAGGLSVNCVALRTGTTADGASTIAVRFTDVPAKIQDVLQNAVLRAIERSKDPAVLVAHPRPLFLASLAKALVARRRRVILAVTPLEIIRWLCDPETKVEVMVVDPSERSLDILDFVREEFPEVRRVTLHEALPTAQLPAELTFRRVDAILEVPWSPSRLELALGWVRRGHPTVSVPQEGLAPRER
jgi:hypothetical protein